MTGNETIQPQHARELESNAKAWNQKPVLQRAYRDLHRRIVPYLAPALTNNTLECGSGLGAIKATIPGCVTSDIMPSPWLDRVENAYRLSSGTGTLDNLILFDVFHHLQYPADFLTEAARAVRPGGRLILIEPGMGWIPRWIYRLFHHEPLGWKQPIAWAAPDPQTLADPAYHAAQANAWRIFWQRREHHPSLDAWNPAGVIGVSCFAYLGSGGFSGPKLYPDFAYPFIHACDRVCDVLPTIFAGRLLVALERRAS